MFFLVKHFEFGISCCWLGYTSLLLIQVCRCPTRWSLTLLIMSMSGVSTFSILRSWQVVSHCVMLRMSCVRSVSCQRDTRYGECPGDCSVVCIYKRAISRHTYTHLHTHIHTHTYTHTYTHIHTHTHTHTCMYRMVVFYVHNTHVCISPTQGDSECFVLHAMHDPST